MLIFMLLLFIIFIDTICGDSYSYIINSSCEYKTEGSFINPVLADDIDNDGLPEIIAGSSNGIVYNFKYMNCDTYWHAQWEFKAADDDITVIKVVDFDKDGKKDLVIGSLDKLRYLLIVGYDMSPKWKSRDYLDSINTLDVSDLDNDGRNDVILGSKNGRIYILKNIESKLGVKLEIKNKIELDNPVYYVKVSDLDNDGKNEIIALTNEQNRIGKIYAFDNNCRKKWEYTIDRGIYQANKYSINIYDIDNDKNKEIIFGTYNNGLIILDSNGSLISNYRINNPISAIKVSDLDNDGEADIIFNSYPSLYVIDKDSNLKWKKNINSAVLSIETSDLDNEGLKEIVTGNVKSIQIFDSSGDEIGKWVHVVRNRQREINARTIAINDFDGDDLNEIASGFGWEEGRLGYNYNFGELHMFEINKKFIAEITTTTTTTTTSLSTITIKTTTTTSLTTTTEKREMGIQNMLLFIAGIMGLFFIIILIALIIVIIVKWRSEKKEKRIKRIKELLVKWDIEKPKTKRTKRKRKK